MMVAPATLADLDAFWPHRHDARAVTSTVGERGYKIIALQVEFGAAFTARASDGSIAAFGGVFPFGSDQGEAWFYASDRSSMSIISVVREIRKVLAVAAPICPGGMFACVDPGNRAGQRLARLCGFERTAEHVGALVKWRFIGEGACG